MSKKKSGKPKATTSGSSSSNSSNSSYSKTQKLVVYIIGISLLGGVGLSALFSDPPTAPQLPTVVESNSP